MKLKKYIPIILLVFSITTQVNAWEVCTPTEEYKKYQKLSDEEKEKYQQPMYCSEIKNNQPSLLKNMYAKSYASVADSSYNSYTAGYATSPKNQYQTGLCWNFASIATIEANAAKKGISSGLDLSEAHLAYSILAGTYSDSAGQQNKLNTGTDGGTIVFSPSYFYGGYGQLTESELSFTSRLTNDTTDLKKITSSQYIQGRNLVTVNDYLLDNYSTSGSCTTTTMSKIKQNIITYGAVYATMYMDQNLFADAGENYYLSKVSNAPSEAPFSNHAITIVGWDDNISKSNFSGATRDGAWIIKNSWGTSWSGDGFFYISYDDEFICNMVANYDLASEVKSYANTYKSSPVVGQPILTLQGTNYISTKFTKVSNSNEKESLEKVSFPVGENMSYVVYLSKDNVKTSNTNWIQLASGTSSNYGIKSVDLSNIEIENDYTIIVKYVVTSGKTSSVFMTTNLVDEYTGTITYQSGKDYIASSLSTWSDLANLSVGNSQTISCQNNIYAYTNIVPEMAITNTSKDNNDVVTVDLKLINIDTNNITYRVENSSSQDVTSHFTITPNYSTNKVTITSDNTISGTFTFTISNGTLSDNTTFELVEKFEIITGANVDVDENNNIYTAITNGSSYTYGSLLNILDKENTTIEVRNINGELVTNSNDAVGTGTTITKGNTTYTMVIVGDTTGDGRINSADLLKIVKYLKNTTSLNESQLSAADCNHDNGINSADLLRIVKFLKGTANINI